ncbi:MAG: UDP-N-acetylmuramate dehydrogenase [Planctomycetota bacterium]
MSRAVAERAFGVLLAQEGIPVRREEPLAPYTTLKVGGPAEYLVEPRDPEELGRVLAAAREWDLPVRILGSGANLLVRDAGVRGAVVRLTHLARRRGWHVEAGYSLPRLVKESVAAGLSGLECLAGVPAAVGGAVRMNAGGRHGEIAGAVRAVDVVTFDGAARRLGRREVGFRYRGTALEGAVVVAAEFELRPDPEAPRRYREILAAKKATQPLGVPSAGCMFKNPPGAHAGRLIDECGLKGARVGRARISRKHANFIVNEGGATADDVLRLVDLVRSRVPVPLELEVLVW